MTPLLSIILCVYNEAKLVGPMLRSLQRQGLNDFEVIVVDDGSTDGTSVAARAVVKTDPRMKLIRLPANSKFFGAYEAGLSLARGEFLHIPSVNDFFYDGYLGYAVAKLQEEPRAGLIYGNHAMVQSQVESSVEVLLEQARVASQLSYDLLTYISPEQAPEILKTGLIGICSVVSRTALFRQYGGYQWTFGASADYMSDIQIILRHGFLFTPFIAKCALLTNDSLGSIDAARWPARRACIKNVFDYCLLPHMQDLLPALKRMNFLRGFSGYTPFIIKDEDFFNHPLLVHLYSLADNRPKMQGEAAIFSDSLAD
jgi:glycosyltransferase involved in cell wall biosynthesis